MARPINRPTKYKKTYCDEMIELGKQGYLPVQLCAKWRVSKGTFKNWRNKNPEFENAYYRYITVVEDYYLTAMVNKKMSAQIVDRIMNRYIDQFKSDENLVDPSKETAVVDFSDAFESEK